MAKIKVLVVDDSALMRKIISDMINKQPDMEVIEKARDGEDLIKKLIKNTPDVITLDVEMPNMNGVETLRELKKMKVNVPVIMLSSLTEKGAKVTFECLENGAIDFVQKPSGSISLDIDKVQNELVKKIRQTVLNMNHKFNLYSDLSNSIVKRRIKVKKVDRNKNIEVVVIGASTGGPKAVFELITKLPKDINVPILVVQHMPVGFTEAFAKRLDRYSELNVVEAYDGIPIVKNRVYIAKGGYHMKIKNRNMICLDKEKAVWGVRPAVDKLFESASKVYGSNVLSVVLTGMGKDGAQGSVLIKQNGGHTISQDESTSTIYGMPRAAYQTGMIDEVLPLNNISKRIVEIVKRC